AGHLRGALSSRLPKGGTEENIAEHDQADHSHRADFPARPFFIHLHVVVAYERLSVTMIRSESPACCCCTGFSSWTVTSEKFFEFSIASMKWSLLSSLDAPI